MGSKVARQRGVRLTPEGMEVLSSRLADRFALKAAARPGGKLTRKIKAELLGVSERTADRILNREPVDRSSLATAFESLGERWQEEWCDAAEDESPESPEQQLATERPAQRRTPGWAIFAAGALCATIAMLIFGRSTPIEEDPGAWQTEFRETMEAASAAYHRADYQESWRLVRKAWPIASTHSHAAGVAWVLRVEGDLLAARGQHHEALAKFERSMVYLRDMGHTGSYFSVLEAAAGIKLKLKKFDAAGRDFLAYLEWAQSTRNITDMAQALRGLGGVSSEQGDAEKAIQWYEQALEILGTEHEIDMAYDLRARVAMVRAERKEFDAALKILNECLRHWTQKDHPRWIAATQYQLARVHQRAGNAAQAEALLREARVGFLQVGDQHGVSRCDALLAGQSDPEEQIAQPDSGPNTLADRPG